MTQEHVRPLLSTATGGPEAPAPRLHARSRGDVVWTFLLFILLTIIHVTAIAIRATAVADMTKLTLMPALAFAVMLNASGTRSSVPILLLLGALLFSWLGDGARFFVPYLPTLQMMIVFFGIAHLLYVPLFWRYVGTQGFAPWSSVYVAWWIAMLMAIVPRAGALGPAVAVYGVVLGATAVFSTRCVSTVMIGGAFFLASDTILAFRIFVPDALPDWFSPMVMITYCTGQGLIAAGVLDTLRARQPAN